ncbi:peroxidase family protein [Bradyrhizobium betae]|uniref:peroxidase family protein n=1 Tax=Bradyrhizobium betae TaxID=244734 RepID=UPI00100E9728|nr:peroxidase family protein [Bradyrhizobium betae]
MGRHGGGFSIARERLGGDTDARRAGTSDHQLSAPLRADALPAAVSAPPEPGISGFRHFLSDVDTLPLEKRFKVDGDDPLRTDESKERLRSLMERLARRMLVVPVWEGGQGPLENADIPAGYTYLLQLVAHDLVQTSFPLSVLENTATGVRNDRAYRLKLDTIYGGGPEVCPFAYEARPKAARSRLRLGGGEVNSDDPVAMNPKGRDIARVACPWDPNSQPQRLTDVMIADQRNDDHAILSQLTTLFHHLHNGLLAKLSPPTAGTTVSDTAATDKAFLCARGAATLIYRHIIRRDVMRRVLNRKIYNRYNVDQPHLLSASSAQHPFRGSSIPLEFTHAAFRFGHAMVRDSYQINPANAFALGEVLRATSYSAPGNMPLHRKWIASWSHFFDVPGRPRPQSSMRISPHFSGQLSDRTLFPPIMRDGAWGLAYRDLMSAAFAGLWSVNSLVDEIRSRQPSLIGSDPLLEDRGYRVAQLRAWLEQNRGELTDADIQTLANDPPLSFYILFEAAAGPNDPAKQGKTLGTLGSIIVAEVIFGAMLEGRIPDETASSPLREALSRLSSRIYAANRLDFVPELDNMGDLVPFVADIANLRDADPTFI